jgi:hypothetical protein
MLALICAGAMSTTGAGAADLGPPIESPSQPPPTVTYIDPFRYEFRFGAFAHGIGGVERNTADVNTEFVLPRLSLGGSEWWTFTIPRPHFGGLANVSGRTSAVYGGALWTVPLTSQIFGEVFVDGAVHNGSLAGGPDQSALGCRALFHSGASLGYAFTPRWSAMFSFDHFSNGKSLFGTPCERNQGINDYGVRFGYSF